VTIAATLGTREPLRGQLRAVVSCARFGWRGGSTRRGRTPVDALYRALPAGSYVFIHHMLDSDDPGSAMLQTEMQRSLGRTKFRTFAEINELFAGLELVEPGVVLVPDWRPGPGTPSAADHPVLKLAAAGVAPSEKRIRTLIQELDAENLDQVIGGWLRGLARAGRLEPLLTAIAIDGKWPGGDQWCTRTLPLSEQASDPDRWMVHQ
jgi:hypothetical protein